VVNDNAVVACHHVWIDFFQKKRGKSRNVSVKIVSLATGTPRKEHQALNIRAVFSRLRHEDADRNYSFTSDESDVISL
jgi:hypothetical protein